MVLNLKDLVLTPLVIFLILYVSTLYKNYQIRKNSSFEYYIPGLLAKIFGAISVCLIYQFYYRGGDTTAYFSDGVTMVNLLFKNPSYFFNILFYGTSPTSSSYYFFDNMTGYPHYANDSATFFVVRLTCLLVLISLKSFMVTTILLASISYIGVWRLYQVFVSEFPEVKKELAIAVLFIPSVFFWGSGLLKDTITLSCLGFYIYSFYKAFIKRQNLLLHGIFIIIGAYIILSIKPYIFFALLPGSLLWISGSVIEKVRGTFLKFFLTPLVLFIFLGSGYLMLDSLSGKLSHYTIENILERAVIVQHDLKQDYYFGNSFDIGEFEATIPSILSKAPLAITAALFRPFLWEVNNPVMFLSALENTGMLLLSIYLIFKVRVVKFIKLIFTHNLLVFSMVFSLFFAFSVGLATSNFGSLVRYKIPMLPFYVASLFIIRHFDIKLSQKNSNIEISSEAGYEMAKP